MRELSNAIEYAFAIGRGPVISEAELPPEITKRERPAEPDGKHRSAPELPPIEQLDPEARRVLRALERAGGHKRCAAESLGMSRTTFWRKLRELGL